MPLRKRKPTSPGRRFQSVSDFAEITRDRPEKSLTKSKPSTGGRNVHGRLTARHRGGGHKQRYRVVDFRREKDGIPAKVADDRVRPQPQRPHRPAPLPRRREALHPGPGPGGAWATFSQSGQGSEIRPGNALPLRYIPVGTIIHNVELKPGAGGKIARGAGMSMQLVAKEGDFATAAAAVHRDAPGADRLPGHRRPGRQRRG